MAAAGPLPWEQLLEALAEADLVISTTGAEEPIVTLDEFGPIEASRVRAAAVHPRSGRAPRLRPGDRRSAGRLPLLDRRSARRPASGTARRRDKELPAAMRIIEQETGRFMAELHHRATGPVIRRLREGLAGAQGGGARAAVEQAARAGRARPGRDPPVVRPAGQQAAAPAAGIAPRRIPPRHPQRAAGGAVEAVSAEGLTCQWNARVRGCYCSTSTARSC